MRALGHAAADRWLAEKLDAVGTRSTLDLAPFAGARIEGVLDNGFAREAAEAVR